jgi:hypothetical protein
MKKLAALTLTFLAIVCVNNECFGAEQSFATCPSWLLISHRPASIFFGAGAKQSACSSAGVHAPGDLKVGTKTRECIRAYFRTAKATRITLVMDVDFIAQDSPFNPMRGRPCEAKMGQTGAKVEQTDETTTRDSAANTFTCASAVRRKASKAVDLPKLVGPRALNEIQGRC